MSDLPIKMTFKSGAGYDAPWVTVDAADPGDAGFKLDAILESDLAEKVITVANLLKAANNAAPLVQGSAAAAPAPAAPANGGWAPSPAAAAPAWAGVQQAPAAPSGPTNGSPHPFGQQCTSCGSVLTYKSVKDGKFKMWACPQQRTKGDGHAVEWID